MGLLRNGATCLRAEWRLKAALAVVLTLVFVVPYFTLQHVVLFPVHTFELTWADTWVAFDPRWVWVYQSVYPLIALVPWLAVTRSDLLTYARGFVVLSAGSFVCFLLFPVACPRPDSVPATGMFAWLVWYDRPTNAMPSLHVGLAAFTLFFGARTSRGMLPAEVWRGLLSAGSAWVAAIAYAALATKQHYAIDLPAGLLAAWIAFRWAFASGAPRDRAVLHASTV